MGELASSLSAADLQRVKVRQVQLDGTLEQASVFAKHYI